MADEYIKRSDAIMAITRAKLPDKTPEGVPIANGKRSVTDCVRRIRMIPSEDVVPVVRCRECIHLSGVTNNATFFRCDRYNEWQDESNRVYMPLDGFCSYGDRGTEQKTETEKVQIVIKDETLYAKTDDGTLLTVLVDTYDNPVYGRLKVWNNPDDNGGKE